MKTPLRFRQKIAELGGAVLDGNLSPDEARADLVGQILDEDDSRFAREIIGEFADRKLTAWVSGHQTYTGIEDEYGQADLFPELKLPRRLETSPGRSTPIAAMTGHDWDTALKCAETKVGNAAGYASKIRSAYDQVRPLLTDESLTTSDVWPNPAHQELIRLPAAR